MNTIYKSAWLHIVDRKVLSTLSKGKDVYYLPGGKPEEGETDLQAVVREIKEELSIELNPEETKQVGVFEAQAHGKEEDVIVTMTCFMGPYTGVIKPDSEIGEVIWFSYSSGKAKSSPVDGLIFDWLKEQDLID